MGTRGDSVPISYCDFVRHVGVKLEPGQRVLAGVMFDGEDPRAHGELGRRIFGDVGPVPARLRSVAVAVAGGRSGKSYFFGALRCLHLALTVDLSRLAVGEVAAVPFVAPDMRLAKQPLSYVQGIVQQHRDLARLVVGKADASESLVLERDGKRIRFECLPATKGGSAVRARSMPAAYLDEACFFRDSSYVVNDAEIYKAIAPRIMSGGQFLIGSTPWMESGIVYEFWRENWAHPKTAIVAHAATRTMRSDPHILEQVAREEARDPDNAAREFGAVFPKGGTSQFFDGASLDTAIDPTLELGALPDPGDVVRAGGDAGFRVNSSTLAITHQRSGALRVAELHEQKPAHGVPLKPSAVVATWADVCARHGVKGVMCDQHYREAIREHLATHGLWLADAPEGATGKADSYVHARSLMREGKLKIPDDPRLLRQLRAVVGKPTSGGGISVYTPTSADGSHGDLVSALVLACWGFSGKTIQAAEPSVGTAESTAAAVERIRKQLHQQRIGRGGRGAWMRG